jgi:hypothetical protein
MIYLPYKKARNGKDSSYLSRALLVDFDKLN